MAGTLRGGLSYALSAPGLWSHDIGGFYGTELTPGLYVRWTQFGCLSPLARAHGMRPREPWEFGTRALGIVRWWVELRYRLLPYLVSAAAEAALHGWPMLRPLGLEFPHDPAARANETQFLLGGELLVAPVLDDGEEPVDTTVYLPPGSWVDFFTGEQLQGPTLVRRTVRLEDMPVFARAGAVIPMGPVVQYTGEWPDHPWDLHAFPGADRTITLYQADLRPYTARLADDETAPVLLVGGHAPRLASGVVHRPGQTQRATLTTRPHR
jgi:alpha-D-xyloside xylohydrolase